MLARHNEITITRGETFTMNKKITNLDGSPYIVSSELQNPHWLITITPTRYSTDKNKVINKWLDISNYPRFKNTQPVKLPDGFSFSTDEFPNAEYNGDETSGYANVTIFYENNGFGVISYKYWKYINNIKGNYRGEWVDYSCDIITTYSRDITLGLAEQDYLYNINLVAGPINPNFSKDGEPIIVNDMFPILPETKLYVKSNLKGVK